MTKIKTAGYVKLAKLWEKNRISAINYHFEYYGKKFANSETFELVDVYIDITGKKETFNRLEMVRLLSDIQLKKIDCIFTQTKAYLAANNNEFFYLIKYLYEINPEINIVTEDEEYNINTYINDDFQKEELLKLSNHYVNLSLNDYKVWKDKIELLIIDIKNNGGMK